MGMSIAQYKEMRIRQGKEAIKEYSLWVAQLPINWDWYVHLTFDKEIPEWKRNWKVAKETIKEVETISVDYAIRMFKRWRRIICEELWGRRFREKRLGLSYTLGIENEKTNLHIHAILGNSFGLNLNKLICRMCIKGLWEEIGLRTGIARVENFDYVRFKKEQSVFYLAKHQIKKGNIKDFFVFNYEHFEHPVGWVPSGCSLGWFLDLSGIWCAGICKKYYNRILRENSSEDRKVISEEQGEQISLF